MFGGIPNTFLAGGPPKYSSGGGGNNGGFDSWQQWLRGQGGEGRPMYTGYQGQKAPGSGDPTFAKFTPPPGGYGFGGGGGGGGMPPEALDSLERARERLAAGQFANSQLGRTLMGRVSNSYGYSPELLKRLEVEAGDRQAGRLLNSRENATNFANSRGGLNSAGLADLHGRLESESAAGLTRELNELHATDQQMGMQRELTSAEILARLFGLEQGQNMAAADLESGIQWPTGGSGGGGAGGSAPWVQGEEPNLLNERGEIMLPSSAPDWMKRLAMTQRQRYMAQQQGGYVGF
jgi:hypothetical protein